MSNMVEISGRQVGTGQPCLIIAEAGINHDGDAEQARRLVREARKSGADVVKFQTFQADRLMSEAASDPAIFSMIRKLELTAETHRLLWDECRAQNIIFLSTPFDEAGADLLDSIGVQAFKIASGELTYLNFLRYVARKGKPMIISTGMGTLAEVASAVNAVEREGNDRIILLHCVSRYPTAPAEVNLRAMDTMRREFGVPVGFSDHTQGIEIAVAAAAIGAAVIEKHFTIDSSLPGPDHKISVEPHELSQLVRSIRNVESAMGDGRKLPADGERQIADAARRSLTAARFIKAGAVLKEESITARRPGTGMPPERMADVVGRTARIDIPEGALLTPDMFR